MSGVRWPAVMSRKEAAEYCGVSASFFSELKALNRIKSVKYHANGKPLYRKADLDELIESLEYGDGSPVVSGESR